MMKVFRQTPNLPFAPNRWVFLGTSIILLAVSLFLITTRGLNYGTDFLGGVKLQYQFPAPVSEGKVRRWLSTLGLGDLSVVRIGDPAENRLVIKIPIPEAAAGAAAERITPALAEHLGGTEPVLEMEETVGPKVGKELRRKGMLAVLFSLFCMLVYIGFRFDFLFAPGAILALFHDVLISLGIFALLQLEFNLTILAAFLTIVGYSLNDTIVVCDRIREHARLISPGTVEGVVNQSVNETLARTLMTSLTTFFVVAVLYFFGGATLQGFAFAMMLGIIFGTFSTFSVVVPTYIAMYRWRHR